MNHIVYKARASQYEDGFDYQAWSQRERRVKSLNTKAIPEKNFVESKALELSQTSSEEKSLHRVETVMGTTTLYQNGQLRFVPMPTPDPRDPLNLPKWRKVLALAALCFFGGLGLAAESIIGALLPVFALEYAGLDPKVYLGLNLSALVPHTPHANPLALLETLPGPPFWKISLLSSLPILTNGLASYFLVPLSISIGRRPVLVGCGMMTWIGGIWAALSTNLDSHLGARCLQAIGAGAVEALIPLAVADIIFISDRNKAMSMIWAAQGIIIVTLGISAPVIVATYTWRVLYWITSAMAIFAWILLVIFLPESRWARSKEELSGGQVYHLAPGETRPRLDETLGRRTLWTDLGFFVNGLENRDALKSIKDTVRTMFFPNVIWIVIVNSIFMAVQNAAQQSASSVLILAGWKFKVLGLAVMPLVIATPFVWLFGGFFADKVANWHARRNGGKREPEAHLLNLILPVVLGGVGMLVFGYAGDNIQTISSIIALLGIFLIAFGFLTATAVLSVYMIESYPQWAGPVLVNISSFRCIIGFAFSFRATTWITELGYFGSFGIYAGVLGFGALLWPVFYFYGKKIRLWTAGTVETKERTSVVA